MATASVDGLASSIKWNDLIDAQIQADRSSTKLLEKRRDVFKGRQDAVRSFNTKLLSLQLDLASLNRPSQFNVRSATSSNSALGVSATSAAVPGTYTFDVVSVARANQLATAGQASSSNQLGADTIHLQLGSGATTDIVVDAANSSLDGIARAINNADAGVTATVVNDGSGATPYRLMLASKSTGVANKININASGTMAGLFTGMTVLQTEKDASIRLGGTGGLLLTQASNTFSNVISGVTVTAQQDGVNGVSVTVGTSTDGAKKAVKAAVDGLNTVAQYMAENASLDKTTNKAGVLFGESDVRNGYGSVVQTLLSAVPGLPANLSTLTAVGITYDRSNGKFVLDESVLDAKLAENPSGVMRLFTNSGSSTDPGIQFASMNEKTSVNTPFAVSITAPATKALVGGVSDLDASTVIDGTNRNLTVTVNDRAFTVQLTAGTYTRSALTSHLQAVLDQKITTANDKLTVGLSGNQLTLSSAGYGTGMKIEVNGASTANTALRLSTAKISGTDVQGTIDGVNVFGNGQVLSGKAGTTSEGLQLLVTAAGPVASATVTATKGLAQMTAESVKRLTDSTTGAMTNKITSLQTSIDTLNKSITKNDERLALRRERYLKIYQSMERVIQQANSQGDYLKGQIKSWQGNSNG